MNSLVWIPLFPLIGAVLIALTRRGASSWAIGAAVLSLGASAQLLAGAAAGTVAELQFAGLPAMPLRLSASPLSSLLSTVVAIVGALVLIYARGYMKDEPAQPRFFALMLCFVGAMQTLVLAGDWVLLLAAWEVIGLSSYLLIGFDYHEAAARDGATRAFLYTRSADLGLYIAVFVLIAHAGSSDIGATLAAGAGPISVVASLALLLAAMGKSAQLPFQDWLMGAMAGPTPVSALLHSATLVAAGAILLIRTTPFFPTEALFVVGLVGGLTALVSGLAAWAASDLKRLLAASTSSQYGLMFVAIGAGVPLAALLHLVAHAAIKSSLFLAAGVFQHSRKATGFDELRGVGRDHRAVYVGFIVAALALAGIPPLSGFYSKDAVIAASLASPWPGWLGTFALAGTVLSGAYLMRATRLLGDRPASTASHRSVPAGLGWMGVALATLVGLAAALGLAFPSLETFVGGALGQSTLAQVAGLVAALAGIALGGLVRVRRLPPRLRAWAAADFPLAGGMHAWVVRPSFAIARRCAALERRLYHGVIALGHPACRLARAAHDVEGALYRTTLAVGRHNETLARGVWRLDRRAIDRAINWLVEASLRIGAWLRSLQSGLIHRELALSVAGMALISAMVVAAMVLR